MPRITSITEQKKNIRRKKNNKDSRYNIFLEGKYAFSLNEELVLKNKLKEGINLSRDIIDRIKNEDAQKNLLDKSINFLSYRPRSEKEVKDYLIKTIAKKEEIKWSDAKDSSWPDLIIKKLKKYGLLDDEAFTKWWIQSRLKSRPKGRRLLQLELKRKGISLELLGKLIPAKSHSEVNLALKVLKKKERLLSKLKPMEKKKKIFYYLSSRGFDYETINDAFAIYIKND